MQNLIFGPALFYDIPEYLSIVLNHSFWQVFFLGHFPIHPIFLGILWILIRAIPVNAIAMVFGALSIIIFYRISKLIFKKGRYIVPVVILALFPGVTLININLMVESVALTFFLLSVYFFLVKKHWGFFIALFLMVGVHLESIFWIPAIFILLFIFRKEIKIDKKEIIELAKFAALSVLFSVLFYLMLYALSGKEITGTTEQLSAYLSSGPLRMMRNVWLSFTTAFGVLTLPVLLVLIAGKIRSRTEVVAWLVLSGDTFLIAANWQGDFMPRRIIFAGVVLALAIYKYLGKWSILAAVYLLPIALANIILYSGGSPFESFDQLPKNQILIETHYYAPFARYDGTILWVDGSDLAKIDGYLEAGRRVFLAGEVVTTPYRLLVGNNYHITSLGKIGDSDSRVLFTKYILEPIGADYELKLPGMTKVSADAGKPVISYDESFWGRLSRRRIDYGDIGIRIWAVLTNHRDPTGWTYLDVRGI